MVMVMNSSVTNLKVLIPMTSNFSGDPLSVCYFADDPDKSGAMPWVQSNDLHTRVAPHDKSSTPATLTPTTPLYTWCSSKFLLVTTFSTVLCFMFVFLGKFSLSMSRGILYMTSNTSATPNSGPPVKIGNLLEFWRRSMVYGVQCCLHNLSKPNRPICVKSKEIWHE